MEKGLAVLQLICGIVQVVLFARYRRIVKAAQRDAQRQPQPFK